MAANDEVKAPRSFPNNPVEGFTNGALLDLRVRLAADFLRSSPAIGEVQRYLCQDQAGAVSTVNDARTVAGYALELAGALLSIADERGWINDIPEGDALTASERSSALRSGRYNAMQQVGAAKQVGEEQAGVVVPAAPSVFKGH